MTNKDPDLVQAIDATAHKLLRKIGGDSKLDDGQTEIFVEQVKAFDVVVRWAQARKALLPPEEKKDSKFAGLKREFHGSAESRNRRGSSAAPAETGPSSVVASPGADPDPGDGADED